MALNNLKVCPGAWKSYLGNCAQPTANSSPPDDGAAAGKCHLLGNKMIMKSEENLFMHGIRVFMNLLWLLYKALQHKQSHWRFIGNKQWSNSTIKVSWWSFKIKLYSLKCFAVTRLSVSASPPEAWLWIQFEQKRWCNEMLRCWFSVSVSDRLKGL